MRAPDNRLQRTVRCAAVPEPERYADAECLIMKTTFKKDKQIAEIAAAYALDAVDIAKSNFDLTLDWSEESVEGVEALLTVLHEQMGGSQAGRGNDLDVREGVWQLRR